MDNEPLTTFINEIVNTSMATLILLKYFFLIQPTCNEKVFLL